VVLAHLQAFYLPWEELPHWAQIHMPEYGKDKVLVLIECIADTFKIKRQQKRDLLAQIDAEMAEFA
jgi:syndetin